MMKRSAMTVCIFHQRATSTSRCCAVMLPFSCCPSNS